MRFTRENRAEVRDIVRDVVMEILDAYLDRIAEKVMEKIKTNIEENMKQDEDSLKKLENKMDLLEQSNKSRNLIIFGFLESQGETVEKKIISMCSDENINMNNEGIFSSYRVGRVRNGNRDGLILVKFSSEKQRECLMLHKKRFVNTKVTVGEDITKKRNDIFK
ncbi:hypothetical protein HHI36_008625 [Cryptolaemus montrouzieri]|uniref:Uncharacterized protein n=1 Tax=Cryptolaemus montrouzieri TaxID=559131 RepID=A0ABD2MTI2_9CUCU